MKRNTKNLVVRNYIGVTLICIVCILFLSFLLQVNRPYNFKQETINSPTKKLQISANNLPEQLWNTTWGGSEKEGSSGIALDSSNNIYLSGWTTSFGAGSYDMALVKYNSLGEQQWNTTWGGSGFDSGLAIEIDSSNNIYVCGFTNSSGAGSYDMALVKYNSLGEQQWNTTWGGSGSDVAADIAVDSLDNVYLVGSSTSFLPPGLDMVIVKYNSLGEQQWNTTWGGSLTDAGYGIAVDSSDNIYLVGYTFSFSAGQSDFLLVKYNSLGEQQWNTTWGGVNYDSGNSIALDMSNNIYVTGGANSTTYGPFIETYYDMALVKYNSLGEQQWNTTWGGSGSDSGHGIAINTSNYIYLVGRTNSFGVGNMDMVFAKYSSSGELQWNTTLGGSGFDSVNEIEIDPSNNIYITGVTNSSGAGNDDMVLIKYAYLELDSPILNITTASPTVNLDINLAWTTSPGADNYTLYRHTSQITSSNLNSATVVKTITGTSTTDTVPSPGRWYYAIVANNEIGSSDPSNSPHIDVLPSSPILNITTTSPTVNLDINLTWTTPPGADNYTLYRHTSQITSSNLNSATEVKTVTGTSTTDTVPGPGRWYYAIVTNNEAGSSDPSNSPYIDVQEPPSNDIPGYNLILLVGVIGLTSAIIIKKRNKSIIS